MGNKEISVVEPAKDVATGQTDVEGIKSLIRSITKDDVVNYLQLSGYDKDKKLNSRLSVQEILSYIVEEDERNKIVHDLQYIREVAQNVDEEGFRELCSVHKIKTNFHDSLKLVVIKCLVHNEDILNRLRALASVKKETDFEVIGGKPTQEEINLGVTERKGIVSSLRKMIEKEEPGRKCFVELEKVKNDILLNAYFEQREKKITRFLDGEQVETIHIKPASKAQAKYNITGNRLSLKYGGSKKIRNYLMESFGLTFFKDNAHFQDKEYQSVYSPRVFESPNFKLELNEEDEEVESVSVVEETLKVQLSNQLISLTLKGDDVENALKEITKDELKLENLPRQSVTLKMEVKQGERTRPIRITISDNNKVSYNPKYSEVVGRYLRKWGIEVAGFNK